MTQKPWYFLAVLCAACSSGPSGERLDVDDGVRSPLASQALIPVPCCGPGSTDTVCSPTAPDVNVSRWTGSQVELAFADALAECTAVPEAQASADDPEDVDRENVFLDPDAMTRHVLGRVAEAIPTDYEPATNDWTHHTALERWRRFRSDSKFQCDPDTLVAGREVSLDLDHAPLETVAAFFGDLSTDFRRASRDLRTASVNYCIATRLRARMPGASAGPALLWSDSDQRDLLGLIRDRAQIASLQYALLGVIFSAPGARPPVSGDTDASRVPALQFWGNYCSTTGPDDPGCPNGVRGATHFQRMGQDLAGAVQLLVTTTAELRELLARSASARTAAGSGQGADRDWGPGSWWQRQWALMYGGDALVAGDGAPWQHPLGWSNLSDHSPGFGPTTLRWSAWPDEQRLPYHRYPVSGPQVGQFGGLVRTHDLAVFVKGAEATSGGCGSFIDGDDPGAVAGEPRYVTLYKTLEALIRAESCAVTSSGSCVTDPTPGATPTTYPAADFPQESYVLFDRYAIRPEHAQSYFRLFAEALNTPGNLGACATADAADTRPGPYDVLGEVAAVPANPSTGAPAYLRIGSDFRLVQPFPNELASRFTRVAPLRFPLPLETKVAGLYPVPAAMALETYEHCMPLADLCPGSAVEAKRQLGAASALTAIRSMIISAVTSLPANTAQRLDARGLLGYANRIVPLINAAIGEEGASVRALLSASSTSPSVLGGRYGYSLALTYPVGDPFWTAQSGDSFQICASNSPQADLMAARAERGDTTVLLGRTLDAAAVCTSVTPALGAVASWGGSPGYFSAAVRVPGARRDMHTFFARRVRGGVTSVRLIAGGLSQYAHAAEAQYVNHDVGALTEPLMASSTIDPVDPTRPAIDGFGLSTSWVPPLSAELVGGVAGQASSDVYLSLAEQAATDAVAATEQALASETASEVSLQAQRDLAVQAQEGMRSEREALCGPDATCNARLVDAQPDVAWYAKEGAMPEVPDGPCPCEGGSSCRITGPVMAKRGVDCLAHQFLQRVLATRVTVAQEVLDEIDAPAPPPFTRYSGGDLQSLMIEQWRALKAPGPRLVALAAAATEAKDSISYAEIALQNASAAARNECDTGAYTEAFFSGFSATAGLTSGKSSGGGVGISWSPATLMAQDDVCEGAQRAKALAGAGALAARSSAFAKLAAAVADVVDVQATMVQSGAAIASAQKKSALTARRYELEQALGVSGLSTSFGLIRRQHAYDLWRAKALIENSRRYALAARRSIEARYAVDLSRVTGNESFVTSPSTWADDVYRYDLSLPAAVGLSTGAATPGGVYVSAVKDYVANLRGFVAGFAVSRPSAIARDELDVVQLPGLAGEEFCLDADTADTCSDATTSPTPFVDGRGQWSVQCAGASGWLPIGANVPVSEVCGAGARPTRARLEFLLDPWGRVNGSNGSPPFTKRYNTRWTLMAVNLVGTGLKQCDLASDPAGCYADGSIRYDLTHVGPSYVTDYDEIWRIQGVPRGQVEGARALAAELWLDPLRDGWGSAYVNAVKRSEFEFRPIGGAYALELTVQPEVNLQRLERVQLLVGSTSWVKQD